jgi:hypothetical protein
VNSDSLFPEEVVRNQNANDVWKRSEVDKLLNLYLSGVPPKRVAQELNRNPKAIVRKLQEYNNNERERVTNYKPVNRYSRKGKRLTENETALIKSHSERGIPIEKTAAVLQRDPSEIGNKSTSDPQTAELRQVTGTGVDLIMAYRYLYYVQSISLLSDKAYDDLEKEELEFGAGSEILKKPGSDNPEDYPPHIRALALYIGFKYGKRTGEGVRYDPPKETKPLKGLLE